MGMEFDDTLNLVWYDAKMDLIFQSAQLEAFFCYLGAVAIPRDFWKDNPHIELIGFLND